MYFSSALASRCLSAASKAGALSFDVVDDVHEVLHRAGQEIQLRADEQIAFPKMP
jgi:hypothetical protein